METLWSLLGGRPELLASLAAPDDPHVALASTFDVTGFARDAIAAATLAAAELLAHNGTVHV
jgi:hypothetical protein